MKLSSLAKALLASAVLWSSVNALAAEPITVSGSAAFTSDYLFRGVSQSSNNAAVQGAMTLTHESGAYVSAWGSSIGTGSEMDLLLGYGGTRGEISYDVGIMHYGYPGADSVVGYDEVYASVSTMGAKIGLNYSNDYYNQSDKFMYLYTGYSTEVSGVGLSATVGLNTFDSTAMMNQALGTTGTDDSYIDYKVAASTTVGGVGIEGAYIGSDIDEKDCAGGICEGRFVLTASKGF